jgi:GxxExxY protein
MRNEVLTGAVIGCFYTSYNDLEFGLPESHYVRALDILFREQGILARREHPVDVLFHGERIGTFRLDFLIEDEIIVEVKAAMRFRQVPRRSCSRTCASQRRRSVSSYSLVQLQTSSAWSFELHGAIRCFLNFPPFPRFSCSRGELSLLLR